MIEDKCLINYVKASMSNIVFNEESQHSSGAKRGGFIMIKIILFVS